MAFISMRLHSDSLKKAEEVYVIMPEKSSGKVPVLYLLHGLSDDNSIWMRRTSIERYVQEMNLAVVMPDAARSFYTDMQGGGKYGTYISEELPSKICSMFNISEKRQDTFIAGLSMGGYGAFKTALVHPVKYCFAASLSGAIDISEVVRNFSAREGDLKRELELIFGSQDTLEGSIHDLFYLLEKNLKEDIDMPYLYQCCGTEDYLYSGNVRFRDFAVNKGIKFEYEEGPGVHNWAFWDMWIQKVLSRIQIMIK